MNRAKHWGYGLMILVLGAWYGSSAVARNHGAVTAIAAMNNQASVFVGYSSGAVAFCGGALHPCQFYQGTPNSPVTAMDTSRGTEFGQYWVFVGYQNGDTYLCSFSSNRVCRLFNLEK